MGYDEAMRLPDGRVLSYLDAADPGGTPIIFCHGSPSSRLAAVDFAPVVAEKGGRIIAPDRPGLGRSEPEVGRSLAGFAADVADLGNALGLARFRVLGVSGGGPYALATAWALPDRVERVALLSSSGSFDIPGAMHGMVWIGRLMWRLARWQPRVLTWLLKQQLGAARKDPDRFAQRLLEGMRGEDRAALEALAPAHRRRLVADPLVEALRQDPKRGVEDMRIVRAPWGFGVEDIRVPVHLWHGSADTTTPLAMGRWLAALIPGADAHILEGEGHMSTILRYADEAVEVLLSD